MTRVVCPVCRSGFEANITPENVAINCVACGVAFNASQYLSRDDFSVRAEKKPEKPAESSAPTSPSAKPSEPVQSHSVTPASNSTRTAGLPFMAESAEVKVHSGPLNGVNGVEKPQRSVQELQNRLHGIKQQFQERRGVPSESAVAVEEPPVKAEVSAEPVAKAPPPPPPPAQPERKKTTRRPLLEGCFGPYDIESEIARGGVGAVFKARERDTGREVALKVLLEGPEAGDADRERFQHECETAKALSLPGMVQVHAVGEIDHRPYMAMELVNGRSLDKVIPEKSLSVNDCLVLMKSVSETIGALHEAGYVHRDLKPGNILIDAFGSPKVADFGLVKSLDEITRLTASGLVCGTPAYMAPEQARGDGKAVDPRSDVWALGAVLYEMLTGRPPFQAENALRLMLKITKDAPRPPRTINMKVPQDVQYIVTKCLEKNPEKRYQNARAMAADINRFLNGEPLEIRSQSHERVQKLIGAAKANQRSLLVMGGALAAVVVVAMFARTFFAPKDAAPLVDQGFKILADPSYREAERLATAEKFFNQALDMDAKSAKAYLGLGLCEGRTGIDQNGKVIDTKKVADAMAATTQAAALDSKLKAEAAAQQARFCMWMKKHVDESRYLEDAVQSAPANLKYREALAIAYWNAGAQTNSQKYFKDAVNEFQYILNVEPSYPKIRGYIQQLKEQFLAQQSSASGVANQTVAPRSRR